MPKKQHTISNFVNGINRSVSPREDSSAIQHMTDLDPVSNIGEVSTFRSIAEGSIPQLPDNRIHESSTKTISLSTMGHDFAYAIAPTGRYNNTEILTGSPSTPATPTMNCEVNYDLIYGTSGYFYLDVSSVLGGMKWSVQMWINGGWKFLTDPNVSNGSTAQGSADSGSTWAEGEEVFWIDMGTQSASYDATTQDDVNWDVDITYNNYRVHLETDASTEDDYIHPDTGTFAIRIIVFCNAYWLKDVFPQNNPDISECYNFQWMTDPLEWWTYTDFLQGYDEWYLFGGWDYFPHGIENHSDPFDVFFYSHNLENPSYPAIVHTARCDVIVPSDPVTGYNFVTVITPAGGSPTTITTTTTASQTSSDLMVDLLVTQISSAFGSYTVTDSDNGTPSYFEIAGLADGTQFEITTEIQTPAGDSYVSVQKPTQYIVLADKFAQINIFDDNSGTWHTNIDRIAHWSTDETDVTLFTNNGIIRACDTKWNGTGAPRWSGHIKRTFFGSGASSGEGNTTYFNSISAWHSTDVSIEPLGIKSFTPNATPTTPTADHPISVGVVSVTDADAQWTNADGDYKFGVSTLYDDNKQESKINTDVGTGDNEVAVGSANESVRFVFTLYESPFVSTGDKLRVSGFRLYAQEPDSERWYLQAEVSMSRGIRRVGDTDYLQWLDADYDVGTPQCHSLVLMDMQRFESYEVLTGHSVSLPSVSFDSAGTGWTTATECSSRVYYGNISIADADGQVKELNDAMVRSDVNKPDKVAFDNIITVTENDGESIIALKTVGTRILQFKEKALYIIDTSSGYEILEKSEKFMGVKSPKAVVDVVGGVAWVNRYGLWYYNGSNRGVVNLLEVKGIPKIPMADWTGWYDSGFIGGETLDDGWVIYDPSTQWLYAFKTSKRLYANGIGYAFNMGTGTLCTVSYDGVLNRRSILSSGAVTGKFQRTNSIEYKYKTLFATNQSDVYNAYYGINFASFGEANMTWTSSVKLITADMNFGNPISRKKIVRCNISHKSDQSISGFVPVHRENGTGTWKPFVVNDSYDGEYLLFNDNKMNNPSFETQGGSSTDALNWTLTEHGAVGSLTIRQTNPIAIHGTEVVNISQGSSAQASGGQASVEQTSITLPTDSTYILSFWIRFGTTHGIAMITNPPADAGHLTITSATGGTGASATYYNGNFWQSALATIPFAGLNGVETLTTGGSYGNLLTGTWVQLTHSISTHATNTADDNWGGLDIGDLSIKFTLPDMNSSTLYLDRFSLTDILYSGYTVADLVPTNTIGDSNGRVYSTQIGLFGSSVMIDNQAKINDISVIYRERNVK